MRSALAIAVASLLAACASDEVRSCPGELVAPFSFEGTRIRLGDPALDGGLDPQPSAPDCPADAEGQDLLGFPERLGPDGLGFGGTLARNPSASTGALCRDDGQVLFGSQGGDRWRVEDGTTGAVLGRCDPTCAASLRLVITGDVRRDASGPTAFEGTLVEVMTQLDGACGSCVLPCAARYSLVGTVAP